MRKRLGRADPGNRPPATGNAGDGTANDAVAHDPEAADEARRRSRRAFLRGSAIAAAGAAVGAGGVAVASQRGAALPAPAVPPRPEGTGFDHLVVLMYENRSFDNLMGRLYGSGSVPVPTGQSFEGVTDEHSNPGPGGSTVSAHVYGGSTDEIMSSPRPDPGEEYPFVNTQLFGKVNPGHNSNHKLGDLQAPFNAPAAGTKPTMDGFVRDYVEKWKQEHGGKEPSEAEYRVIMGGFSPEMLPVFTTLARNFAIYDGWHCAVPSQTFCNRSFFHASTSHGFVTNGANGGYGKWLDPINNTGDTIFNRLEDAGVDWAIYYDDQQLIAVTGFIHAPQLEQFWTTRFRTMSQFKSDAASGMLPAYSFIEPRMLYNHNDMHPPVGPMTRTDVDGKVIEGGAISDVRAGEALLHDVYTAVRESATESGSNAMNTVLLVTFDEHGGTFDHVPPPAAPAPDDNTNTEMGFGFDRLGVRVPALVISAYTPAATVINDPMHHGSVISTLCERHGLDPLTKRDDGAPTLKNAITLTTPRDPSTWPTTFPHYVPANSESADPVPAGDDDHPLSPPGVGLMGLLVAKYGAPGESEPRTYREAWSLVQKHGKGLFGGG